MAVQRPPDSAVGNCRCICSSLDSFGRDVFQRRDLDFPSLNSQLERKHICIPFVHVDRYDGCHDAADRRTDDFNICHYQQGAATKKAAICKYINFCFRLYYCNHWLQFAGNGSSMVAVHQWQVNSFWRQQQLYSLRYFALYRRHLSVEQPQTCLPAVLQKPL